MKELTPYLFFDGNCRDAMQFYAACLGGELQVMTYGEVQGDGCPLGQRDKVIHASVQAGGWRLMASDTPDHAPARGDNVQISVSCETGEEIEQLFKALSEEGKVTYPLHDAFWGAVFGTLTDRFGVNWMLNYEKGSA